MQVIPDLRVGGAERVAVTLANGLAESGHDALLLTIRGSGPQEELLRKDIGVQLHVLGIQRAPIRQPIAFARGVRKLRTSFDNALNEFQPDIVQTHIPEDDLLASDSVRRTGIGVHVPLVHSLHFHLHREKMDLRGRVRLHMFKRMLNRTRSVWAVSGAVARAIEERASYPADRISVLHNCVDLRPYEQLPSRPEAKAALGLPPDAPLVLSVGRLHLAKNFPMLVRASAEVLRVHPKAHFALVGEGDERAKIEAEIMRQGVSESWTLLGQRPDVPHCLAAADSFVQPSDWEGCPIAVVEAMAAGLPVIATDVAGVGEVIKHETHGLLIPRGDEAELSATLLRLLSDSETSARLASSAKQLAWAHYNLDAYIGRAVSGLRAALEVAHA
ncbi:MAG: glycosyltransferase [Planctomycetes bacterium]|nr:glycosyltransferase [Planctomycetota bacterium]